MQNTPIIRFIIIYIIYIIYIIIKIYSDYFSHIENTKLSHCHKVTMSHFEMRSANSLDAIDLCLLLPKRTQEVNTATKICRIMRFDADNKKTFRNFAP